MTLRRSLLAVAVAAPVALAQDAPARRAHHALVYDPVRQRVLLSGGSTPLDGGRRFDMFGDLWAWDGARWTRLDVEGDRMSATALVWDASRRRILSFGGYDGGPRGDLRALDTTAWRSLGRLPGDVADPGVVYDAKRDRFITFGGSTGPGRFVAEAREWDGTTWATIDGPVPPPRAAHAMVYDERRGVTVLFGGMAPAAPGTRPSSLGDTWEFDGRRWTLKSTEGPLPRASPGATYDSKRGLVILFGGSGGGGFQGDTWAWDGVRWRQLATDGPEPRAMGVLAYDAARDRVVLFGGRTGWPDGDRGDTWEWDGRTWTKRAESPPR